MMWSISKYLTVALSCLLAFNTTASADISLNFSENSGNQGFAGGELIGPLNSDSSFWNNTNGQDDLAAGTLSDLVDETGANTGVSVTWSSSNVWFNGDGTSDDQHRMAVGYLDDGDPDGDGIGISITFSDVPYALYRVYGLLTSDQNPTAPNEYETRDFTVNGGSVFAADAAPAYGTIEGSLSETGQFWSLADGTAPGNYWVAETTGATLTITGPPRNGPQRGSITGVVIQEIPEPASALLICWGALLGVWKLRRR